MAVIKRNKWARPKPERCKPADSPLASCRKPEDMSGENSLLRQLTRSSGQDSGSWWLLYNGRKVPNYLFSLDKDLTNAFNRKYYDAVWRQAIV